MSIQNNKKALAEQIKTKLNSPEYVAMPDLITYDNRYGKILAFLWGSKIDGNIHKKDNWIDGKNINPGKENKHQSEHMVEYDELEKEDWEEIVNLIEKRNEEKEQIFETKKKNIEQKLNQQPNLYYYWGRSRKNERANCWCEDKGMCGFTTMLGGNGNGLTHRLYIAEEHPVLDNFPFQTGFYYIDNNKTFKKDIGNYEGGFRSSGGETNPCNWKKYVEANDQITITPYEIRTDKPVEKPTKKSGSKTNNNLMAAAGGESKDNRKNTKKDINEVEKNKTIEWITQYFKDNQIKEINLVDNKLVITNGNNETVSSRNNHELQNIESQLEKNLKLEELQHLLNDLNSSPNSIPSSPKKDHTPYLVGGAIGIGLTILIVGGFYLWKNKNNNKDNKN